MSFRVYQVPSPKHYVGRSDQAVIALVHHRMVGTLASTDATFTTGTRIASTNFGVGYDCGRSGHPQGKAGTHVHQYVMVDDAAWGNGNLDVSGSWDDTYGANPNPNYRTISIEHHDNGGAALGSGRGIVPEEVLAVSIELDRLLLGGDWAAWKVAGITANTEVGGARVAAEVGAIVPSTVTIIDHHFIAGRLKPYCWQPWADDPTGFPQARYLAELAEEDDVITAIKGEDWTVASRKPVRNEPRRINEAIVGYLEAGTIVRTLAEATSSDDNVWRLTEFAGAPGWLLRSDLVPLVPGGDPVTDQGLTDYIARLPSCPPEVLADARLAGARNEWDDIHAAIPPRP